MRRAIRWLAVAGCTFLRATSAVAQPAQESGSAPSVVAPRLKTGSPATYPEEAARARVEGDVTVIVLLEIDEAGKVRAARVQRPQGFGFDEAAVAAASKLVFEPARRAGVPVASRIAYRYVFHPPPPPLEGLAQGASGEGPIGGAAGPEAGGEQRAAPGGAAKDDEPEDVVVRGDRPPREVTKRTLTKEEIDHVPGTSGDALRSIQSLPGVARPPPFSGQLVVRGSAPEDTTVFVDGVDVPLVYHFGGLSSVIPTDLLDKIDFYPSNYSAVYGRGMGGMVDVRLRAPRSDRIHGMAQVDFIDARVRAEGPIGETGLRFLVAARRSYFDLWLGPALKGAAGPMTTAPRYYDAQAIVEKDIDGRSTFRLSVIGSDDKLEILNQSPSASTPTFGGNTGAHTSFWRAQARYENRFTDSTELRIMGSVGHDSIDFGIGPNFFTVDQTPFNSRLELTHRPLLGVQVNVGADVGVAPYDITLRLPPPRRPGESLGGPLDVPQETHATGSRTLPAFYTEWELSPREGTRIVPSLRADYTSTTKSWELSPRVNARQDLVSSFPRSTLKGGAGLFSQPPTPVDTDPTFGQRGLKTMRAAHFDAGFEQDLTRQVRLSTDLFYKALDRLIVPGAGNAGRGRAYGAELLVHYSADERFFGWIAYTLSRSERRDTPAERTRLFAYDQTHVLTVVGSYKLGGGWRLGGRFRFASGGLYTPQREGALDATAGVYQSAADSPQFAARLPPFHQLDLRVDKTWAFESWSLTAYADIQNVYYHQSPEGISYNYNYTQSTHVNGLPILPSLGIRGEL